ncbi:MAG: WecB/TagA/CpsF family glycosyltransferase [Brevinematia bacterium]
MHKTKIYDIELSQITEEELSEIALLRLIEKKRFSVVFVNTNIFFRLIFDKNFRKVLKEYELILPSSGFISGILSNLLEVNFLKIKESSCIFRILRKISDYNYRILIVGKDEKMVSKFKKNILSSMHFSLANIIGIYNIYDKRETSKKLETIRKLEPDIIVFGDKITKHLKFFGKNPDIVKKSSLIFSNSGVKVISGTGFETVKVLNFFTNIFQGSVILLWFLFKKLKKIIRGTL